jgi:hypothetical protein
VKRILVLKISRSSLFSSSLVHEDVAVKTTDSHAIEHDPKTAGVKNPFLLLAFSYFDLNGCGFIAEKDLEDLFLLLGLCLSRSQAKKLVQKVAANGVVSYLPIVTGKPPAREPEPSDEALARGNLDLLTSCFRQSANESFGEYVFFG